MFLRFFLKVSVPFAYNNPLMLARRNKTFLLLLASLMLVIFTGSFVLAGAYHEYCHHTHAALHEAVEQLVGGVQLAEEPPRLATPVAAAGGIVPPSPARRLPAEDFSSGVFRPPTGPA